MEEVKDRGLLVALDPDDGLAIACQQFGLLRHARALGGLKSV
jgi:hypothetical protein